MKTFPYHNIFYFLLAIHHYHYHTNSIDTVLILVYTFAYIYTNMYLLLLEDLLMNKAQKIIVLFLLLPFICIFIIGFLKGFFGIALSEEDYARITDIECRAVVIDEPGSQGKIHITERLTFDIHAASKDNLFWELWRDLSEEEVDGVYVTYNVLSVKQILDSGQEIIYKKSPKLYWDDSDFLSSNTVYGPGKWYHSKGPYSEEDRQYECLLFYVDGLYREEVTFEIEYEMYNASLRYDDCSYLYVTLYGGEDVEHLKSFKAEILVPNKDMPSKGNYETYGYGTNSNSFFINESSTKYEGYHTFSFSLNEDDLQFRPYNQYIEFDLLAFGEDKHIFTDYASRNYYYSDVALEEIRDGQQSFLNEPDTYRIINICIAIVLISLSIFIIIYCFTLNKRMQRKYTLFSPAIDYTTYRDIPSDLDPCFAASLVSSRQKKKIDDAYIYSAILLSLARKRYIELRDDNTNDVTIILNQATNTLEPLTKSEELYYNLIVRHVKNNLIKMSQFQHRISSDYKNTCAFVESLHKCVATIGTNQGYFQKADYCEPKNKIHSKGVYLRILGYITLILAVTFLYGTRIEFANGSYLIFAICCFIGSKYLRKNAGNYLLLTQYGANEYSKWRGLYNFLSSDTFINDKSFHEVVIWEKYLVYSTAFGISDKITNAIKVNCYETYNSTLLSNRHIYSRSFRSTGRRFSSAVRTGSYSGGYSSGSGGRGGGGGGGGH